LTRFTQIPAGYHEAASLDGVRPWAKFIHIPLPLLTPVIFFNLVMQLIFGFMIFTQAYIVTGGAPLDTTLFYNLYLFIRAFQTFDMGFVMVYPLLWMFASLFKGPEDIWTNVSSLIPREVTTQNYIDGWRGFGGVTFTTFFKNSFIVTGISTVASVFSSTVMAYGFARIRFVGRGVWFALMLATMMLSIQVQIIPQYIVFSKLGWVNTYIPLILPHFFAGAFVVTPRCWLFRRIRAAEEPVSRAHYNNMCYTPK
jgi:ABC-type glycerol-3-phosphate transport system permease component